MQKLLDDVDTESLTKSDWDEIEKLASQKGKVYLTGREAKQHLDKL